MVGGAGGGGSRGREIGWGTQFKAGCEDPGREDGKGLDMTSAFPAEAGRLGRKEIGHFI